MNNIKTHYQYDIQMLMPSGRWVSIIDTIYSISVASETFSLYKGRYRDDVRLMRRKITVGEWEVQK